MLIQCSSSTDDHALMTSSSNSVGLREHNVFEIVVKIVIII